MNAKYNKTSEKITLSNGTNLLVHFWKGDYYILPKWELSCDISNKGFTLKMYSKSIKGLVKNINEMILAGVNF